jgi:hypothetical protein
MPFLSASHRRFVLAPLLAGVAFLGHTRTGSTQAPPERPAYLDPDLGFEARVNDLVSRMTVEEKVSHKAVATAKHFAVHSGPEPERHEFDARPNGRDLYETYLPAFRDLVQEGTWPR